MCILNLASVENDFCDISQGISTNVCTTCSSHYKLNKLGQGTAAARTPRSWSKRAICTPTRQMMPDWLWLHMFSMLHMAVHALLLSAEQWNSVKSGDRHPPCCSLAVSGSDGTAMVHAALVVRPLTHLIWYEYDYTNMNERIYSLDRNNTISQAGTLRHDNCVRLPVSWVTINSWLRS